MLAHELLTTTISTEFATGKGMGTLLNTVNGRCTALSWIAKYRTVARTYFQPDDDCSFAAGAVIDSGTSNSRNGPAAVGRE